MSCTCSVPIKLEESALGDCITSHTCDTHGSSAIDIVCIHGLHDRTIKDGEQVCSWKSYQPDHSRRAVYCVAIGQHSCNDDASRYHPTQQAALDTLSKVALHRKRLRRTTSRIIFVAEGSGYDTLSQALHLASSPATEKMDTNKAILTSTYGVISLPTPRRRRILSTALLTAGQLVCYTVLHDYEARRASRTINLPSALRPYFQNPSTRAFVCAAFTYGILATITYHINSADCFQRHFIFGSVLVGIYTILPSLANLDQHTNLVLASPLSLCITIAMVLSTCCHWIWRTFLSTREARLESKIAEWERDAVEMDVEEHVVNFHEIN